MSNAITKSKKIELRNCPTPNPASLSPYQGEWTWKEAAHLMRRSLFGPTYDQIKESLDSGLEKTIEVLFEPQSFPDLPINYYFENDPEVPIGETWVGKKITPGIQGLQNARNNSLSAWIVNQVLEKKMNILQKMILFWHNHLVISDIFSSGFKLQYFALLHKYALGDFKQFVTDITINPGMLLYLNGNENTAEAPNENYGRELMELFTIGKGPLVGDGDYTNYTEQDVVEFSRALSGWVVRNGKAIFRSNRHDKGVKQLSHRFGNKKIGNLGADEYKKVVDIIFAQEEVSKFICRQLYIWFANYEITEDVENNVIVPMAKILRDNNYVVKPVVKALLQSEHFYSECIVGAMIKSPIDFAMTLIKTGEFPLIEDDIIKKYRYSNLVNKRILKKQEQSYFGLPSVAGWPAYYQEPVYYKIWLSSVTLPLRKELVEAFIKGNKKLGDKRATMDLLSIVSKFESPDDPDKLLISLTDLFLTYRLTDEQYLFLKTQVLLPGLPDYEWTVEYSDYINNPGDESKSKPILNRLKEVMLVILNMAEFQMM